jgi:hypothetical protein
VLTLGTASKLTTARNIKIQGAVEGDIDFDGSKNIIIDTTQNNISVLSGQISIPASDTQGTFNGTVDKTISYPKGYTKSNCKVINISTALPAQDIYSTGNMPNKFITIDFQRGMIPFYVSKIDSGIQITAYNAMKQAITINYEIVLIKI